MGVWTTDIGLVLKLGDYSPAYVGRLVDEATQRWVCRQLAREPMRPWGLACGSII